MLKPNKTLFKKFRKYKTKLSIESKSNELQFGMFAIQALENGRINSKQIETIKKAILNFMKKKGKFWIRVFPSIPITKKPTEVRMGKGKGNVCDWISFVRPGLIIFEISSNVDDVLKKVLNNILIKLPFKSQIVQKLKKKLY